MATRNEHELNPAFVRELGAAQAHNDRLGQRIDAMEATEHFRPPLPTPPPVEASNDFEERIDTAVKRLSEEAREVIERAARERMPSSPGTVNVYTGSGHRDSSEPPSRGAKLSMRVPIFGSIRAKGLRAVIAVLVVAALLALAWMAGHRGALPAPEGSQAPADH